jgi:hypothetical protein
VTIEDIVSDIASSHSNSSNVPRDAILPLVAPALSELGPGSPSESQAQLSHPPDVPHKADIFIAHTPQDGFKTAVMQSPEPRFLDTVMALIRAWIAARSTCDEFVPQAPKVPPDKPVVVGKRHPYDVVNGFNTTNTQTRGSPLPEATLSLPETPPAALSQVPIPCSGFNGHKPRFDEGEK